MEQRRVKMELNEEQLKNVLAGIDPDIVGEKSIENERLYRKEQIEKIKQQKPIQKKTKEIDELNENSIKM